MGPATNEEKTRRSSWGVYVPSSCAAPIHFKSFLTGASFCERTRVRRVWEGWELPLQCINRGVCWTREDVVVVITVGISRLRFRLSLFARDGERVRATNTC